MCKLVSKTQLILKRFPEPFDSLARFQFGCFGAEWYFGFDLGFDMEIMARKNEIEE